MEERKKNWKNEKRDLKNVLGADFCLKIINDLFEAVKKKIDQLGKDQQELPESGFNSFKKANIYFNL